MLKKELLDENSLVRPNTTGLTQVFMESRPVAEVVEDARGADAEFLPGASGVVPDSDVPATVNYLFNYEIDIFRTINTIP